MKGKIVLAMLLAATALVAAPVGAKARHASSCKRIQDAFAAGKTSDEISRELKVSAATVKRCMPVTAKAHQSPAPAKATKPKKGEAGERAERTEKADKAEKASKAEKPARARKAPVAVAADKAKSGE